MRLLAAAPSLPPLAGRTEQDKAGQGKLTAPKGAPLHGDQDCASTPHKIFITLGDAWVWTGLGAG